MNRLHEKRTVELSLGAISFLNNCISQRGGTHPGEQKRWKDFYFEAQEALLDAVAPAPPTCTAEPGPFTTCQGLNVS